MKLKMMFVICLLCFANQSYAVDFPWTKPATINAELTLKDEEICAERYIESIKKEAEFKARKESLEGELFYLRLQNIALFIVVGYMAVNN